MIYIAKCRLIFLGVFDIIFMGENGLKASVSRVRDTAQSQGGYY